MAGSAPHEIGEGERAAAMSILLNIDVPDLGAGETFYVAAFGLRRVRRLGTQVSELGGWPIAVFLLMKAPGSVAAAGQDRCYRRHWTPVHFDVVVADIEQAFKRAVTAGAVAEEAPTTTTYGAIAMLADPFGNGFCLIEFNEVGYTEADEVD